jgi:ferredoxin
MASRQEDPNEGQSSESAWIIDQAACTQCGRCVLACPESVVVLQAGKLVLARPGACTFCGLCEELCPVDAIALAYEIVWGENEGGPLSH